MIIVVKAQAKALCLKKIMWAFECGSHPLRYWLESRYSPLHHWVHLHLVLFSPPHPYGINICQQSLLVCQAWNSLRHHIQLQAPPIEEIHLLPIWNCPLSTVHVNPLVPTSTITKCSLAKESITYNNSGLLSYGDGLLFKNIRESSLLLDRRLDIKRFCWPSFHHTRSGHLLNKRLQ